MTETNANTSSSMIQIPEPQPSAKKSKGKLKLFNTTDLGNAKLFAYLNGGCVLFDHKQGRWLIWNEKRSRWQPDAQKRVWALAESVSRYRFDRARRAPHDTEASQREQKFAFQWAYASEDKRRIDAFIELAKSEDPISDSGENWDTTPWMFGVANGLLDLRTGKLRPTTQIDRVTKFSPVAFDPGAKCPRFEQFLNEIFAGDAELIRFIQKAAGYSMTGETTEQCLFALHGVGSNGKSTLLEILYYILGNYAADLPFASLEAKQRPIGDGSNLPGIRFVKSVEVREGRVLDEGRIKSWTGQDVITVRPLYQNSFSFRPAFKLWMAFNHKPIIRDDSVAMWRRIHLVAFAQTFDSASKDKDLSKKLWAEAPGILNWMLEGCLAWQKEGLEAPEAVNRTTLEYAAESDHMTAFFEDGCEKGDLFTVSKGELRTAYESWCSAHREKPKNKNDFPQSVRSWGFGESKNEKLRFWTGLRLRPTGDPTQVLEPTSDPIAGPVPDLSGLTPDTTDTTKGISNFLPMQEI